MIFRHLPCKQLRQGPDPPAQTQSKSQPRPWDAQLLSSTAKKKEDLRRGNSWDNSQPQSQLHIKRHAQSERWVGIWGFYWAEGTWSLHTECRAQEAAPICSWERGAACPSQGGPWQHILRVSDYARPSWGQPDAAQTFHSHPAYSDPETTLTGRQDG